MTQEVSSRPLPPPTPVKAASGPTPMDRVDNVLEALWHFLSSMRVAMVIMLVMAGLAVLGAIVMQAPAGIAASPEEMKGWLDEVRPKYGGWTGIMDALGLFNVFNSIGFRILVASLTISLLACSVHRIPGMWRTARNPRVDVGPKFFEHAPHHEAIVSRRSTDETFAALGAVLRGRRYRILTQSDDAIHVYADRFRWAPFGGLIAHLSIVVILAGAIAGGIWGYRDAQFAIAEGATLPVAAEPGLTLQLLDFTDKYDTVTGSPIDYASQVVLYKDGVEIDRHTIRVNDPLRYGNTTFYQAFFGQAATITVKDATGKVLVSQGVPLAWRTTADNRAIGSLDIPGTDYVAWIVGTLGNGDTTVQPGQMQVELFTASSGTQVDSTVIDQGKDATMANLTFTFERESQYAGLNVARDPGVLLIWFGSILLVGGFVIRLYVQHKRVWARIVARPSGGAIVGVASLGSRNGEPTEDFNDLVSDIRAALTAPAAQG